MEPKDFEIEIIRVTLRRKTIQAKLVDDVLKIYLPSSLSKREEERWIKYMKDRFIERRESISSEKHLIERAERINKKFFNSSLNFSIRYTSNQNKRFGSCTPETRRIRISDRVAKMPSWVQDYVILHELTHLIHPDHSKKFWEKVNEYKYTERAKGYLIAVGMNRDEDI